MHDHPDMLVLCSCLATIEGSLLVVPFMKNGDGAFSGFCVYFPFIRKNAISGTIFFGEKKYSHLSDFLRDVCECDKNLHGNWESGRVLFFARIYATNKRLIFHPERMETPTSKICSAGN